MDVGIIMGSQSDWETMQHAAEILQQFGVSHECRVVSAHRTPAWMQEYATMDARPRGPLPRRDFLIGSVAVCIQSTLYLDKVIEAPVIPF